MPVDRLKGAIERLIGLDLLRSEEFGGLVMYDITPRGQQFLDTYWRMRAFTDLLEGDAPPGPR